MAAPTPGNWQLSGGGAAISYSQDASRAGSWQAQAGGNGSFDFFGLLRYDDLTYDGALIDYDYLIGGRDPLTSPNWSGSGASAGNWIA